MCIKGDTSFTYEIIATLLYKIKDQLNPKCQYGILSKPKIIGFCLSCYLIFIAAIQLASVIGITWLASEKRKLAIIAYQNWLV